MSNYTFYRPNYFNSSDFQIPSICNDAKEMINTITPTQRLAHMFHIHPDILFDEFVSKYGKSYSNIQEKETRKQNFVKNLNSILTHRWEYNAGIYF